MNDRIANQIARRQAQLTCADRPEHRAVWEGNPPARFGTKLEECRILVDDLESTAGIQSTDRKGIAQDKRREEAELEQAAFNTAGLVVAFAREAGNETLATKYDKPISTWRQMRDAALIQTARELQADVEAIVAGADAVLAADYGIDAAAATNLESEADDYDELLVAPQEEISNRKQLTESLPTRVRQITAEFDTLELIARAFRSTDAGDAFYRAFVDAGQVIDRGHGPSNPSDPGNDSSSSESEASSSSEDAMSSSSSDAGGSSIPSSSSMSYFSSSSSSFSSAP